MQFATLLSFSLAAFFFAPTILAVSAAMAPTYVGILTRENSVTGTQIQVNHKTAAGAGNPQEGELLEGWYDPATKNKADAASNAPRSPSLERPTTRRRGSPDYGAIAPAVAADEESDDEFGPALPSQTTIGHLATGPRGFEKRVGPAIPNVQDLEYRDELLTEDQIAAREDLKALRKLDRNTQKERLEELVPRADPGSRERKLEKKKEVSSLVASARDAKEGGTEEVDEGDLMGDDGVEGFKKRKKEQEKKKSERELRKEELWRVRAEEREERLRVHKEKEDKTMDMFKKLAAQRFGAG
ncbi:hypothetical protein BLS_001222 [Venturia inaequalis]|uniref:Uncharacterized protein n=1 Tax=Venturia inaequalis TaxID=5025 RepID=A0A8H3YIN3_VENIN|nr:hypothetical protein BLS_001222 [Venturia inaequalis]